MPNNKISVIMPSFLGYYEGCAENREVKFQRAVKSFLSQKYKNAELIIVSDGCEKTEMIYNFLYSKYLEIRLIKIDKQPLFSVNVRQAGIKNATGKIICYLDSDDMFGQNHLYNIAANFNTEKHFWVYYNDFIFQERANKIMKSVEIEKGSIGTSSVAHINSSDISWAGCDGYNHDWTFIERMKSKCPEYKKIYGCEYFICHIPNAIDL